MRTHSYTTRGSQSSDRLVKLTQAQVLERHPMTLWRRWLAQAKRTPDPEGDLIGDMRDDDTLPATFSSEARLWNYLQWQGACSGALGAVAGVWRRYQRWLESEERSVA